jgi:diaminohydroxyphosphoribosylaminopyrimidine deaminase/5-amino-6-(5-phosphoribosylamino)uracil reductase
MAAFSEEDRGFMAQALALAERGLYTTTPNPRVGCVVVNRGAVVGRGWHEAAGGPHAEVLALREAGEGARGATLYLNLEPCSLAAGIARVVAAMQDPNPRGAGAGFARMRSSGVAVEHGLMEAEARELNAGFVSRMERGRPWVLLKVAASLDGRTALANGASQWITGEAARHDGHRWRARACAILTGIGTVKDDDPRLTVRGVETPRQPLKVLIDSRLEVDPGARLFEAGAVLVVAAREEPARAAVLRSKGAEVVTIPNPHGKTELMSVLRELGRRGINELHVEAGTRLNGSLLREGCVDELLVYLAPSVIGDSGRGMFSLPEITALDRKVGLSIREVQRVGDDVRILARVLAGEAQSA